MGAFIVDVNVAVAANGSHSRATPQHQIACIQALREARAGVLCLDDNDHILHEYRRNLSMSGQPGPGDEFMHWVHQNQANAAHCERVRIVPRDTGGTDFEEFPDDPDLAGFDRSDRKYVAVALSSSRDPEVINATDRDWWQFRKALKRHGVRIRFVCPDLMTGARR